MLLALCKNYIELLFTIYCAFGRNRLFCSVHPNQKLPQNKKLYLTV